MKRAALVVLGLLWASLLWPRDPSAQMFLSNFRDLTREASSLYNKQGSALWGRPLPAIRWMAVERDDLILTEDPNLPGFRNRKGLWVGPRPQSLAVATTATQFAGKMWAMILASDFPHQEAQALGLLIREGWQSVEDGVLPSSLPQGEPTEVLDRPEGRLWLRLEVEALARGLDCTGEQRLEDFEAALTFRAERYQIAHPDERQWERALDAREGIAEYMAWKLPPREDRTADLAATIRGRLDTSQSYVRSFAYMTGPAYGLLMDDLAKGWRQSLLLMPAPDLQLLAADQIMGAKALVSRALAGGDLTPREKDALTSRADQLGVSFGIQGIKKEEEARWARMSAERDALQKRFTGGTTLRICPRDMRIVFDPNHQIAMGKLGTCYTGAFSWQSPDGSLTSDEAVLVTPDWHELWLPLGREVVTPGSLDHPLHLVGKGWTLDLGPGWTLRQEAGAIIAEPPSLKSS
ncbi:MAG: hypothetical protein WBS54_10050 [Acidobacteriota bacterium]